MKEKQCNTCNQIKSLDEFYSHLAKPKTKPPYMYYRPDCKECTSRKAQEWSEKNREKKSEYMKVYRQENIDTFNNRAKEWRENNREWKNEYHSNYIRLNKDKARKYSRRRYRKDHKITEDEWLACKEHFNDSCAYCGMSNEEHLRVHGQNLHKEHVVHEGANDITNCVPSCKACNSQKWKFDFFEWYSPDNEIFNEERFFKVVEWIGK